MVTMRAKMVVEKITKTTYGEDIEMRVVGRKDAYPADGSDENNTFAKFTPAGELALVVHNEDLYGKIIPGQQFYIDFTEVPLKKDGEA